MVADAFFYNRVGGAPYWYTRSRMKAVIEVRYVLQTGFEMDGISQENPLPKTCSRKEAMRQDAKKVSILDHEEIMEDEHDIESGSDVESDSKE